MSNAEVTDVIFFPLLASEQLNRGRQSEEEQRNLWQRFRVLPQEKKSILLSRELPQMLQAFQTQIGATESQSEAVSVIIRWLFFKELEERNLPLALDDVFEGAPDKATKVATFIREKVFTLKPAPEVEVPEEPIRPAAQPSMVSLPLLQAMAKYPNLGNQMLSEERIRLKSQLDPARGSLFSWLKYYRDELGIGRHSSVERGQFLFRSENGRKLHPDEREKVNLVLKSLEENLPLQIDTTRQEIVFPKFEFEQAGKPAPAAPNLVFQPSKGAPVSAAPQPPMAPTGFASGQLGVKRPVPDAPLPQPAGNMSFSFNHILPAEQEGGKKTEAPAVAPVKPPVSKEPPLAPVKKSRFHIRPVSLTYGDEENEKAL